MCISTVSFFSTLFVSVVKQGAVVEQINLFGGGGANIADIQHTFGLRKCVNLLWANRFFFSF